MEALAVTINRALVGSVLALVVALGLARLAAQSRSEVALRAAIETETVKGDLKSAIAQYEALSKNTDRAVAAKALLRLAGCYEKLGQTDAARVYARVIDQFRDQPNEAADAGRRLAAARAGSSADTVSATRIVSKHDDRVYGSTVSRDGRYIAWTVGQRVEVLDLITGEDRRLIRLPTGNPTSALISPDGRLVAYEVSGRVRIIGTDGTGDRDLMGDRPGSGPPPTALDWSADSKQLLMAFNGPAAGRGAAQARPRPSEMRLISIADASTARTFPVAWAVAEARLSPDSRSIVFEKAGGGALLLSIADGTVTEVADNGRPFWTPSGNRILLLRLRRTGGALSTDLWSVRIVNGKPAGDPEFHQKDVERIVAPTGDGGLLYRPVNSTRDIYGVDIDPATGQRVGRPRQLTTMDDSRAPSWSPDGARFAYYSYSGAGAAGARLIVQALATPGSSQVLAPQQTGLQFQPRPEVAPQWFPDSRSILVYYSNGTLGRVDVQTREFTPVLPGVSIPATIVGNYPSQIRMSHDARSLYYFPSEPNEGTRRLVRLDLETGSSKEIARVQSRNFDGLAVSADDRQVAFIAQPPGPLALVERAIMVVDANGGTPRVVHTTREVGISHVTWSADGRRLFYASRAGRHVGDKVIEIAGDIWTVGIDGSDPRPLGIGLSDAYQLNIHPNGKQLIWMEENFRNELWVLRLPAALTGR
jgi:Tol biopolymer transport system component